MSRAEEHVHKRGLAHKIPLSWSTAKTYRGHSGAYAMKEEVARLPSRLSTKGKIPCCNGVEKYGALTFSARLCCTELRPNCGELPKASVRMRNRNRTRGKDIGLPVERAAEIPYGRYVALPIEVDCPDRSLSARVDVNEDGKINICVPGLPEVAPVAEPDIVAQWTTLYDAHIEIACLMLGSMTPELHRQFELYYPFDMIQEFRSMFEKQAGVEKFDLIQSFYACKQER
ncbi:hypothetical protein Tco_0655291 [Tanacetum coccineum]|uniref:Uncharacterized protein n=1 Tax=Tanacetum coccineum TaxID=301880 RepID=A0ABQ4X5Z2_9ASTR